MPTTGSGKFPYPNSSAVPDVPADVLLLAQRIDKMASGWTVCADATARAALVTNSDAYEGLHVYQIDTKVLYIYQSSAWVAQTGIGEWTTYTPSLTNMVIGTGGSAKATLEWRYEGDQVHVRGTLILGSSGSSMGSIPTIGLPVAQTAPTIPYQFYSGNVSLNDVSAASVTPNQGAIVGNNGSTTSVILRNGAGANITSSVPFTWAAGDAAFVDFYYDPA